MSTAPQLPVPPAGSVSAGDLFALVRDGHVTTRSEIGRLTGLSRTSVTARVTALLEAGFLVESEEGPSTGGRPPTRLALNAAGGVVLAVALGRSRTQVAVCDLAGTVLASADDDQEIGTGPDEQMAMVTKTLRSMLERLGRPVADIRGVGVSIPGTADLERGCSRHNPMMPGWDGVPLASYFSELGDPPVLVDNDANVLVLSERNGHLRRFDDVVMVKASTGLGAGIVSGGVLQRGALGAAGEIGHVKTAAAAGARCRCGDTGCLEAVAGGWALVRRMRDQGRDVDHVRDLVRLALDGDAEARGMVRESGRRVGEVLAGVVTLLNPAALVVGGDMADAYEDFVAGLREMVYAQGFAQATGQLEILPSTHGGQAGVVGSAAMVLERILSARAVDAALA